MGSQLMNIKPAFRTRERWFRLKKSRSGIVLITAIVLIAAMMMIGTALMLAANMDTRHSGMERSAHNTFFDTDGMLNVTVGLLKVVLSNGSMSDYLDNSGPIKVVVRDNDFDMNEKDRINDPNKAALAFYAQDGTILGWTDVVAYDQAWGGSSHSGNETDGGAAYKELRVYVVRALGVSPSGGPEVSRIVAFYQSYE